MPDVVGMSDAVMAMRRTLSCAKAGAAISDAINSGSRRIFMAQTPSLPQVMQELGLICRPEGAQNDRDCSGGQEAFEALQIGPGVALVVDALGPEMDVRHHGPQGLAQGAGGLHGEEGSVQ